MFEEVKQHGTEGPAVDLPVTDAANPQMKETGHAEEIGNGRQMSEPIRTAPSAQHAEAGRKGAFRIHELVRLGKLYEQEHGLKRGRQRRRQLLEEGKLYEQEHGLNPTRKRHTPRRKPRQILKGLLQTLSQLAKPKFRPDIQRLIQTLENEQA